VIYCDSIRSSDYAPLVHRERFLENLKPVSIFMSTVKYKMVFQGNFKNEVYTCQDDTSFASHDSASLSKSKPTT